MLSILTEDNNLTDNPKIKIPLVYFLLMTIILLYINKLKINSYTVKYFFKINLPGYSTASPVG